MDSKPKRTEQPEKLRYAMESLIRLATEYNYAIAGFMVCADPPDMVMLRNTTDDPARFLRYAADMIDKKAEVGQIENVRVTAVN